MQALCTLYPAAKHAREAAGKLFDDIVKAVATQTFVAHTAANLSDEEMEVIPHPSRFVQVWSYFPPPPPRSPWGTLHNMPNPSTGDPIEDSGRRHGIHTSTKGYTNPKAPSFGLAQQPLVLIATLAHAIWLAIPAPISCTGTLSPLISRLFPCNHLKGLAPSPFHTTIMALSLPSPMELPTNDLSGCIF